MKPLFLTITGYVLLVLSVAVRGEEKLKLQSVTVFLNGAELTSTAQVNLQKGENEVDFTNVAGNVNTGSISVGATNGVVVASVTFRKNYLANEVVTPRVKEIQDSIELLGDYKLGVNNKLSVLKEEIKMLRNNRKTDSGFAGYSVGELTKMLDLVNARLEGLLTQKDGQEKLLKKADERLGRLKKQLDEEKVSKVSAGGMLLVKLVAREATAADITVDYVSPYAGWTPSYDIMADNINSPIKLYYKANIHQSSGINWDHVHLALSTGNPNEGITAPVLNPWYLEFYAPPTPRVYMNSYKKALVSSQEVMPLSDSTMLFDMAGSRANAYQAMDNHVSVDNGGVNTTFDIDLPYSIACDGQQHLVAIKSYELPANYHYYAVPKKDKDAFLEAQVTKWEDLNLLPGTGRIFYEGAYVGEGGVDVRNLQDTLNISLGRDKKILLKWERETKYSSVKMIGENKRSSFGYAITVRNTRKETINLTVVDQLPVSNDKDIVLEDVETGGATHDETTGKLQWNLALNPGDNRKLEFSFTVKSPKGKTVTNL